ncbi:MAG: hypothetical protein HC903_07380 [Methylacidiphilales bacterium]|nr:hypothetical protein [Candidatus Methylacidiphilales bacterium]NJR16412.1 hypothetical protein [Calothrix sp. CSU_2_0]
MATIGKYCKAYLVKQLREYSQWQEKEQELTDEDVLYLQENYVVTKGIYLDESIIFDDVIPEWQEFCHQVLNFEIPNYQTA